MASSSNMSSLSTIEFIKFYTSNKPLTLPTNFVQEQRKNLGDQVFLVVAGQESKVELFTDKNGNVGFRKGWQAFVYTHSIPRLSVIRFLYDGRSHFYVRVYSPLGIEIMYPTSVDTIWLDTDDEKEVAIGAEEQAWKFPYNNPILAVHMQMSYLNTDGRLWVPADHTPKYIKQEQGRQNRVVLKVETNPESSWIVDLKFSKPKEGTPHDKVRLAGGWLKFASDNNLQVGDQCVFELIEEESKTYMVHIIR